MKSPNQLIEALNRVDVQSELNSTSSSVGYKYITLGK